MNLHINTDRLTLKPIDRIFADEIFQEFTDEITKFMGPKPIETLDGVFEYIAICLEKLEKNEELPFVIIEKKTKKFIGCTSIHEIDTNTPEIGIWIKKSAHGNRYGLEAVTELISWAKENLVFEYLRYPVDKRNTASRKIPEKNGGVLKEGMKYKNQKGFELDEVEYWIYNQ